MGLLEGQTTDDNSFKKGHIRENTRKTGGLQAKAYIGSRPMIRIQRAAF